MENIKEDNNEHKSKKTKAKIKAKNNGSRIDYNINSCTYYIRWRCDYKRPIIPLGIIHANYKRKDGRRIVYITYEDPLKGKTFTEKQMHEVYRDLADKTEYPDFECWKTDMLKSGVFQRV